MATVFWLASHSLDSVSLMPTDRSEPSWADLFLPDGFAEAPQKVERAEAVARVDLDGLYPVDQVATALPAREFWLSTVHNGRIVLGGAYKALGEPSSLAVLAHITDPGVAMFDAALVPPQGPVYPTLTVGRSGASGRVSLPRHVLHRLHIGSGGGQVLMTMARGFLVLLNPAWSGVLTYWDEEAERVFP